MSRCPGKIIPPIAWEICRDVGAAECGILPAAGGWLDQAFTWKIALELVAGERWAYLEERRHHD